MAVAVADRKQMCREATDAIMCAYIQVPFCTTLCRFCCWANRYDRRQVVGLRKYREAYLNALEREIRRRSQVPSERDAVDLKVIHFGGGTPSVLTAEQLIRILGTLTKSYDVDLETVETVGIEIRADSVLVYPNGVAHNVTAGERGCRYVYFERRRPSSTVNLFLDEEKDYERRLTLRGKASLENFLRTELLKGRT